MSNFKGQPHLSLIFELAEYLTEVLGRREVVRSSGVSNQRLAKTPALIFGIHLSSVLYPIRVRLWA